MDCPVTGCHSGSIAIFCISFSCAGRQKTVTLNKAKFSMEPGSSTQLKVQNTSKSKVQSVTWSVIKGKDVVKLSAKSKKSVIVKAVKKGKATIQAKIKTSMVLLQESLLLQFPTINSLFQKQHKNQHHHHLLCR